METDRLKYFCVIAESGSLTAASHILNVSHSGLSKAMSVLQAELQVQLFRPLGRGLELTEAGRRIYSKSKSLLESFDQLKQVESVASQNIIRVGMAEVFALGCAGPLASILKENGFQSDFYECDSGDGEVQLMEGKLDFTIGFVPFPHPELEYLKIRRIPMGVYTADAAFLKKPFSEIPFVVPNYEMKSNPLSIKSRDGWPSEVPRHIQFGANSLSLAMRLVEQRLAAVFMPAFLGQQYRLYEIDVKKSILQKAERDIFIVKKKNIEESKAMKLAAKVIRQIATV